MKFWDSSAIVPLLVQEVNSPSMQELVCQDPDLIVWYGTRVELESAINRRLREGSLSRDQEQTVRSDLKLLEQAWHEVQPTESVRHRALRLLRVHPLRATDAFQLAAALIACSDSPEFLEFVTVDIRLREAAEREGFPMR
jgi:predicted nucleic acid-binding protein